MYCKQWTYTFQGKTVKEPYPDWVMVIAGLMITVGVLPMPVVFILRRCQCLKLDLDIHQGAIRRIDTTVSTKEMMGDVDVSYHSISYLDFKNTVFIIKI
jgi:solute carrier family 6 amino acid/orphan transporter-like 15/16/17/18/20